VEFWARIARSVPREEDLLEWMCWKASIPFPLAKFTADFFDDLLAGGATKARVAQPLADDYGFFASGFNALALEGHLKLGLALPNRGLGAADSGDSAGAIKVVEAKPICLEPGNHSLNLGR